MSRTDKCSSYVNLNSFILITNKELYITKSSRRIFQKLVRLLFFFFLLCVVIKDLCCNFYFVSTMLFFHNCNMQVVCHNRIHHSLRRMDFSQTGRELTEFLGRFMSEVIKELHAVSGTGSITLPPQHIQLVLAPPIWPCQVCSTS